MRDFALQLARILRIGLGITAVLLVLWSLVWVATRPLRRARLSADQVEIKLVHWGDDREDAIVAKLVRGFEKKYPGIRVLRINPGGSDATTTKVQTMVAAGAPPDVFQIGYERVASWAEKGLLADLGQMIERDGARHDPDALRLKDFYKNVIDCFRFDGSVTGRGRLYALAKDFTTVGFYYNKDLFRRAGLPMPSADGWTWDEFISAARKIGQLPNCYGADFVTWEAMLRVYCWSQGARFTENGFQTFDFSNEPLRAALDRLRSWFFDEDRTLASAKTQLETGEDPFLSGRIGMAGPLGRWKVPVYRLIEDFDWDFAPLPHAADQPPANGVFTSAWAMSAKSAHSDAAWKLIRYLCGEQGQRLVAEQGLAIPSMIRVAQSKSFSDPTVKPQSDAAYLSTVPYARAIDWPADAKYLHQLRVRMEEVFKTGEKSVATALADVQRDWQAIRDTNVMRPDYPPMPWMGITIGMLVPLGALIAVGAVLWWRRRPNRAALREEWAGLGMVSPWLIGFALFTAFPIVLSLLLSFSRWGGLSTLDHAEWIGLDNFRRMLADSGLRRSLWITTFYAALAVPLGQVVALAAAVLMNCDVRGSGFFRAAWYLPSVLAGVAIAIMWKWVFHHDYGLLNLVLNGLIARCNDWFGLGIEWTAPRWFERDAARWGVPAFVIMSLWSLGGPMIIYLGGLKAVPRELYEAASIDGAGWYQRLRSVTLPMLSPVILFNVIMAVIASFQVFTPAFVMTGGGPGDATRFYVLYLYNSAFDLHDMSYAAAMAWLLLLIVLGLTVLIMRISRRFVYYEALRG